MNLTTDMTKEQVAKILKSIEIKDIREVKDININGVEWEEQYCFYLFNNGEYCRNKMSKRFACDRINTYVNTCEAHGTAAIIIDNYFSKGVY